MENSKITLLTELRALKTDFTIKVKIISLWRRPMNDNSGRSFSIDCIFIDEMDNKIEATCLHKFFSLFEKYLVENNCLFIKRMSLAENANKWSPVGKKQKLSFVQQTSVKECKSWAGSEFGFDFVDFNSILDKTLPVYSTVDVIGYVLQCHNMEEPTTKFDQKTKKITLTLKDQRDQDLGVTLWGKYAEQMNDFMHQTTTKPCHVFLAIQFATIKSYLEKRSVSNAYNVTRLFINSDIPEIDSFKTSFFETSTLSISSHTGSRLIKSVEDDFINKTEFTNIACINGTESVRFYVILGTIKGVSDDKLWYYLGCNLCKRSIDTKFVAVESDDGSTNVQSKTVFVCNNEKCRDKEVYGIKRFRIPIRVQDSTGGVSLTLFDKEAVYLLKTTANDLVEKYKQLGKLGELPVEFDALLEKKYAFMIKVAKFSIDNQVQSFTITKLSDDVDVIKVLEGKIDLGQKEDSNTLDLSVSEVNSNNSLPFKDSVSYTGENITPSADRKRVFAEVFDVDADACFSSSKARSTEKRIEVNEEKPLTLLIPKIEK